MNAVCCNQHGQSQYSSLVSSSRKKCTARRVARSQSAAIRQSCNYNSNGLSSTPANCCTFSLLSQSGTIKKLIGRRQHAAATQRRVTCSAAASPQPCEQGTQLSVLVTGASSGIGRATAVLLAQRGYQVFGTVRSDVDGDALCRLSSNITAVNMDVTDGNSISAALLQVSAVTGSRGLDALVNNAGRAITAPVEYLPLPVLRQQLEVNLIGAIAVTQAFLPLLRAGSSAGRIINIGSQSGVVATPLFGPYAMSKFAMEALSDSLRLELAGQGIKVILIRPGAVKTPIWSKSTNEADTLLESIPAEGIARYDRLIRQVQAAASKAERSGVDVSAVAEAVTVAISSENPSARSVVGTAASLQMTIRRFLPDSVWDWLLTLTLNNLGPDATARSNSNR